MPELPEVETVVNHLASLVVGERIVSADLIRERLAPHHDKGAFSSTLRNASISQVHRRGKHILIDLDNGRTLMVHLRMSGRFLLVANEDSEPKFTHARLSLGNDKKLLFQDQRHFGFMRIVDSDTLFDSKELKNLAPEPFSEEFSSDYLKVAAFRSTRSLKEFLLDQTRVCGVGNIYASEACSSGALTEKVGQHLTRQRRSNFQSLRMYWLKRSRWER